MKLITSESCIENMLVEIPTVDCILRDKLTAFAPYTTRILLGGYKELEITKQLFDTATFSNYLTDYDLFATTYKNVIMDEIAFRGKNWNKEAVLRNMLRACVSIINRGIIDKEDYMEYLHGIKSLKNHILLNDYNTDDATWKACKVMYLAFCLLSGNPYRQITNPDEYITARLEGDAYKKLAYVHKQRLDAYACLVEATRNLK